jgi:hypothetical protein
MKLGPYERGEVELVEVDETDASLRIQHESGEAHFSLDADDYELVLGSRLVQSQNATAAARATADW